MSTAEHFVLRVHKKNKSLSVLYADVAVQIFDLAQTALGLYYEKSSCVGLEPERLQVP